MKPARLIPGAFVVAGLVAAAGAGYRLGQERSPDSSSGATAHSAPDGTASSKIDPKTGRTILFWHDPMVPGTKFDRPGKSPFMDMALVPVLEDEAGAQGVSVSSTVTQNLGIRTAVARMAAIATGSEVVGTVAENERSIHAVQSRVNGYVEKLHVRANLDSVRSGQPVATLYVPDWVAAQEEYLALRRLAADAGLVDAARQRLRLLSIPDEMVTRAEAADAPQSRFTLRAPSSGVVSELAVREGAMVSPGMTLLRIVDLGRVWVYAEVPESASADVVPGTLAEVRIAAYPARMLKGSVAAVLPQLSAGTRTLRARIELANPGELLKPGMFVSVRLSPKFGGIDTVVVPQEAVIPTGKRSVVIVKDDQGRFSPVEVETGSETGTEIEIRKGISAGQTVVVSGQFLLDSEASLKSALPRLNAGGKPDSAPTHDGEGTVEAIAEKELTLAHGPIPSLKWSEMTMPFRAPEGAIPAGLKVGDHVKFTLVKAPDGVLELTRVQVTHASGGKP